MTRAENREAIELELEGFTRGRVPKELRRRQLLDLGGELFAERGFAATSMDDLAERAGVSKPVIYSIFGSKEGLFVEMVDQLGHELSQAVTEAVEGQLTPAGLLSAGSLAFFRFIADRKDEWQMVFGTVGTMGVGDDAAARKLHEVRVRQDGLVRAVLMAHVADRDIKADEVELDALARAINGAFEGLVGWWPEHPEFTAEQLTDLLINLILPGLERLAEERSA